MIINAPEFRSLNRLDDLPAGRFFIVESVYSGGAASGCTAVLSEIIPCSAALAVAMDIQIILADGAMLFRDFAVAPDGAWRDSYGAKAAALAELFPPELSRFRLVRRVGTIVEHDGKGALTRLDNEGQLHGS